MADLKKAQEFLAQAEEKLKGSTGILKMFNKGPKLEEAADLFQKAGNAFKICQKWEDAGKAYEKAAQIFAKNLSEKISAGLSYSEAANAFRKTNPTDSIKNFEKSIEIYLDMGRISIAAKHIATCAEIYEKDIRDIKKAVEMYEKASNLYKGEDSKTTANKLIQKVAEYSALEGDYKKAIQIYEGIAEDCLDNQLLKYSLKEYYFKACIVSLCYDSVEAQRSYIRYCEAAPMFKDSRESALIKDILVSIEEADVKIFNDALSKFDSVCRLDDWTSKLLLRVKQPMEGFLDIT